MDYDLDMKPTLIYAIKEQDTHLVRYVGKTINPRIRINAHLSDRGWTKKSRWLHSIGYRVEFIELEVVDTDWAEAEKFWIAYLKSLGADLVNSTTGGQGATGLVTSAATRVKQRLAKLGKPLSTKHKENLKGLAAGNQHAKGYKHTEEARRKISDANRGVKKALGHRHSDEVKLRISEAGKGRKPSEETIERMRLAHSALSAKKSEDMKRVWAERKAKKEIP